MRSLAPGLAKWSPAAVAARALLGDHPLEGGRRAVEGLGVESPCQHDDSGTVGERARQLGLHVAPGDVVCCGMPQGGPVVDEHLLLHPGRVRVVGELGLLGEHLEQVGQSSVLGTDPARLRAGRGDGHGALLGRNGVHGVTVGYGSDDGGRTVVTSYKDVRPRAWWRTAPRDLRKTSVRDSRGLPFGAWPSHRPTSHRVRDIAEQSGLSEATIDRVLHGRPGASPRAIRAVERAVLDLDRQQTQLRLAARTLLLDVVIQAPPRFSSAVRSALEEELPALRPATVRARFHLARERRRGCRCRGCSTASAAAVASATAWCSRRRTILP